MGDFECDDYIHHGTLVGWFFVFGIKKFYYWEFLVGGEVMYKQNPEIVSSLVLLAMTLGFLKKYKLKYNIK